MKVVFVHDHKFRLIKGKVYSTGGLSEEALSRYTENFGKLVVIARILEEHEGNSKYSEIKNKNIAIKNGYKLGTLGIKNEIREADCVIVRMPSFLGKKAIKISKDMKKKCIVELVACPWDSLWNHSIKGKIVAPYMTIVTKKIIRDAKYVIYVTNEFLQKRYPTKGESVNCSNVVLTKFDDFVLARRIERIKSNKEKIIIGTIAAIDVKHKGQQFIIEALGKLKKEGINNYEYQLVGSGNNNYLKKICKKYNVEDEVKFLESKPHNEIFNWLENIDIYVQPSRQEGLPRALIEAMSMGVPAFGAKTGGIPELIHNELIFSNTKNNIEEICNILKSFNNEKLIEEAKKNYNIAKIYDKNLIDKRRNNFFKNVKNNKGIK